MGYFSAQGICIRCTRFNWNIIYFHFNLLCRDWKKYICNNAHVTYHFFYKFGEKTNVPIVLDLHSFFFSLRFCFYFGAWSFFFIYNFQSPWFSVPHLSYFEVGVSLASASVRQWITLWQQTWNNIWYFVDSLRMR